MSLWEMMSFLTKHGFDIAPRGLILGFGFWDAIDTRMLGFNN